MSASGFPFPARWGAVWWVFTRASCLPPAWLDPGPVDRGAQLGCFSVLKDLCNDPIVLEKIWIPKPC